MMTAFALVLFLYGVIASLSPVYALGDGTLFTTRGMIFFASGPLALCGAGAML